MSQKGARRTFRGGRTLLAILTSAAAIVVAGAVVPNPASAGPVSTGWGCANTQVVAVPGTWETDTTNNPRTPVGLLKAVTDNLDDRSASINYVPYTARMVDTSTMIDSWQNGFAETNRAIAQLADQCPRSKFVLLGFSQGAGIAGDVATNIGQGTGPIPADRVDRVALFADPLRSPGTPMPTGKDGYTSGGGIIGVRSIPDFGALKDRTQSLCKQHDYICNVNQTATIIPNLAAHFTNVNLSDPNTVITALIGALQAFGLTDAANLAINVLSGKTDLASAFTQLPQTVLRSFGTMGKQLQVPMDLNTTNALSGYAVGDPGKVQQVLGGVPQAWGVIGADSVPLLSYLYKSINGPADLMARVAASLAEIGQISGAVHNVQGYTSLTAGPNNESSPKWVADWINQTLSGTTSLLR